jgi:transposase
LTFDPERIKVSRSQMPIGMKTKKGQAISGGRKRPAQLRKLDKFIANANKRKDLDEWRRGRAVRGYIDGRTVISLAAELGVQRGAVNKWLQWYEAEGADGLRTSKPPGSAPRLTEEQLSKLGQIIEDGPVAVGYQSGVWTGPMIGDLIERMFGVRYHNHYVPRLLNHLGFSVQRPRKRLARADLEKQAYWLRTTFPAIKKKQRPAEGS